MPEQGFRHIDQWPQDERKKAGDFALLLTGAYALYGLYDASSVEQAPLVIETINRGVVFVEKVLEAQWPLAALYAYKGFTVK